VPLKNNYNPQRRLVRSKKDYFGPLERSLQIRTQLRPFQLELQWPSCNRPRWRCRMWTRLEIRLEVCLDRCYHCERSRNYSTTVEELVVIKVGCEISLNKMRPSKNIYVAKGCLS